MQMVDFMHGARRWAAGTALWVLGSALLGGCSWFHFGTPDEDTYDYRKSKPRQEPLDVPPDLSQLPKDDRFALPSASAPAAPAAGAPTDKSGQGAAPAAQTVAPTAQTVAPAAQTVAPAPAAAPPAVAAGPIAAAGVVVAPNAPNARIEREGSTRWLAVDVSPEIAYTTIKDLWTSLGYPIKRDDPLVGIVETDWVEVHEEIREDAIRNSLHRALGAFDSNGDRSKFRARIERTASNTSVITITHQAMVEIVTGVYHDSSKWQRAPGDPELEAEMLRRLALRFTPAQPLRVAVATESSAAAASAAAVAGAAAPAAAAAVPTTATERVHKVNAGGVTVLQVEDSMDRTWRMVGVALDRGGFTVEERRRDQHVYAVRYLDPDYEASEREKKSWWDRLFNSDAKIPEQKFLIALSANGATTVVEVQDKDGRPDSGPTSRRIIDQLLEQMR